MKSLFLSLLFVLFAMASFSQDLIRMKDGTEIQGVVKEVTEEHLVYTRPDQQDGPIRKLSLMNISHVLYADGTKDIFTVNKPVLPKVEKSIENEPGTVNTTGKVVTIPRRGPDVKVYPGEIFPGGKWKKNYLLNSGLYLDYLIGYAYTQELLFDPNTGLYNDLTSFNNALFGLRVGSKFYIGNNEKYRFGLNATWANVNIYVTDQNRGDISFAPANIGLASVFKLKGNSGLEINTSTGVVITTIIREGVGVRYGMDFKYRYENLEIGIDLSRSHVIFNSRGEGANTIALNVGVKF